MEKHYVRFNEGKCDRVSTGEWNCVYRLGRCNRPITYSPTETATTTTYPSYAKDDLELLYSASVRHYQALLSPSTPQSSTKPCVKCKNLAKDNHRKQSNTLQTKPESTTHYSSQVLCDDRHNYQKCLCSRALFCLQCHSCRTTDWTKSKMLRAAGKVIILCVLVSCIAYVIGYPSRTTGTSNPEVKIGGPDHIVMENMFKSISVQDYSKNIVNTKSHYDVLRMFLKDEKLSEDRIKSLLDSDEAVGASKREYDYYSDDNGYYDDDEDFMVTMEKAHRHFDEVFDGPLGQCRDPRPEIVRVQEHGDLHKEYIPKYTVLHRCRNVTGCCWDESHECQVKRLQVVKRPFIVIHREGNSVSMGENGPTRDNVEWVFFVNHTECECRRDDTLPECRKQCPHPFIMTRPEEECICDCLKDAPHCQQIKYGKAALGEEGFDCIKSGRCQPPSCAEGEFDMRKGYCDGTRHGGIEIHHILRGNSYKHRIRHAHRHKNKGR